MKVILLEDVKSLGKAGDLVEVSPGYANNMLFRKKLALEATSSNLNSLKTRKQSEDAKTEKQYQEALAMAEKMQNITFVLPVKCGEGKKLYGAVTAIDVAKAIASEGFSVDKRGITVETHIKTPGDYEAEVRLHPKVSVVIKIKVAETDKKSP
jgi:large subunit ribosomal protein L9